VADAGAGKIPFPLVTIIEANFPVGRQPLLFVVFAAIYVCCLAIQTSTIRLALEWRGTASCRWASITTSAPGLHTPVGTCIVIGVLAGLPLIYYAGAATIAIGATGMIYSRTSSATSPSWPPAPRLAERGRAIQARPVGHIVNILALIWGIRWRSTSCGRATPRRRPEPTAQRPANLTIAGRSATSRSSSSPLV